MTAATAVERRPELPGAIVVGPGQKVGLISRGGFFHQISGAFGREIYLRRPISSLLAVLPPPLRLASDCDIPSADLLHDVLENAE